MISLVEDVEVVEQVAMSDDSKLLFRSNCPVATLVFRVSRVAESAQGSDLRREDGSGLWPRSRSSSGAPGLWVQGVKNIRVTSRSR